MAEGKIISYGNSAQAKVIEGVVKTVDAIEKTLGPAGKCVAIHNGMMGVEISRDGSTVAKSISFKDPTLDMGAQLVKKAASLSESSAGDGTSSTSILIKELCLKGQKSLNTGANVNELKSGMLKAGKWMNNYIASKAISIDGDLEKIRKVATISANNDPEIGNLVVDCMDKVGIHGVITADLASGLDTVIDVTTGMKLERGWSTPQYATNPEEGKCVMENPYVLVVGEKISSVNQIIPIMEILVKERRPFLIICDDMDENVNMTLTINNLQGAIRCCVVKGVDFGDARKNLMQDIAIATGGTFLCEENGKGIADATLEDLGAANKVVVTRDNTIIYEGAGDKNVVAERAAILQKRYEDPTSTLYDKQKFERRIANLVGGIGIIKAGGATEAEKINRKATIEDAVLASKSAISEGCAPGSGYIYFKGAQEVMKDTEFWKGLTNDEKEGAKLVFTSLPVIMRTVVENSGASGDVVLSEVQKSKKQNWGYNAKTKQFGDLLEEGVLDSAKVLRVALENAISTASMILLTDCTIINEPEETTIKP